jgi:hypothetical protein
MAHDAGAKPFVQSLGPGTFFSAKLGRVQPIKA